jgi:quinone-reactive Ni/Fe-hydrogenase small subunit
MRIVIVGGGISAVYLANSLMDQAPGSDVFIITEESYPPYDRIHLCSLVDNCQCVESIALDLHPKVRLELNQKITTIDPINKRVLSENAAYHYDNRAVTALLRTLQREKKLFSTDVF